MFLDTAFSTLTEDFMVFEMEFVIHVRGYTADEGPVVIFICDGQTTLAQVQDWWVNTGPLDPADLDQVLEKSHYRLWPIGVVRSTNFAQPWPGAMARQMHDSYMGVLQWRPPGGKWTFSDGYGWSIIALNTDPAAALTTGATVLVWTRAFGRWLR